MIMACTQMLYPKQSDWWNMIACMEAGDAVAVAPSCASKFGLNYASINACTSSQEGAAFMTKIGQVTNALQPPHQWTPWVVINDKPLTSAQLGQSLIRLVCAQYTGTKPAACNAPEFDIVLRDEGF
jgi:interferon gamma-inducible protein 30